MKNIPLLVACLVMLHSVGFGAQHAFDQGSTIFGITAGFLNASGDLYKSSEDRSFTAILLMPNVTYFFVPKLGVGGDVLLFLTGRGGDKSTTLGAGPRLTFLFGGEEKKFYPYLTSALYFVRHDVDYAGLLDATYAGFRGKLGVGTTYMVGSHLGIVWEASFNSDSFEEEDTGKRETGEMVIITVGLTGFFF